MPRYTYRCEDCEGVYNVSHSIKELRTVCEECSGSLTRVPSLPYVFSSQPLGESSASERVKKHISDAKEELERTRKETQKDYE